MKAKQFLFTLPMTYHYCEYVLCEHLDSRINTVSCARVLGIGQEKMGLCSTGTRHNWIRIPHCGIAEQLDMLKAILFILCFYLFIIDLYPTASQLLPLIAMQLDCRHKYISLALAGRQFVTEEKRSYRLWRLCWRPLRLSFALAFKKLQVSLLPLEELKWAIESSMLRFQEKKISPKPWFKFQWLLPHQRIIAATQLKPVCACFSLCV